MIYFCSDLDNTLIFSHKRTLQGERVLVEVLDGKEISYMKKKSLELLVQISEEKILIPVTTRSKKQYERIQLGEQVKIQYALVANGGILLEHGIVNEEWYEKSKELMKESMLELQKAIEMLQQDKTTLLGPRFVDELFVFAKCEDAVKSCSLLREILDLSKVDVEYTNQKLYVFPKVLTKGNAVLRLKEYMGNSEHYFIAAGDSPIDRSMVEAADVGYCPTSVGENLMESVVTFDEAMFHDEMLDLVYKSKGKVAQNNL